MLAKSEIIKLEEFIMIRNTDLLYKITTYEL